MAFKPQWTERTNLTTGQTQGTKNEKNETQGTKMTTDQTQGVEFLPTFYVNSWRIFF